MNLVTSRGLVEGMPEHFAACILGGLRYISQSKARRRKGIGHDAAVYSTWIWPDL